MTLTLREKPPNRIAVEVTGPDTRYAWHPWDRSPENRPQGLNLSYIQPGGDNEVEAVLARRPGEDWPDLERLNEIRVYGPGNNTLWRGLTTQPSRSWGELQISVRAEGYKQTLNWNPSLKLPYVDRDLNHWQTVSSAKRASLLTAGSEIVGEVSVDPDITTGLPALRVMFTGTGTALDATCQAYYDCGAGATVGSIYYDYTSFGTLSTYAGFIGSSSDDLATASSLTADLLTGTNSSGSGTVTPTAYRFGIVHMDATGITPTAADHIFSVRRLAVFGSHSLTKQGTAPSEGLLGSDIMNHGLTRLGPPVTWTTGTNGSLQPTSFVIDHFDIGREEGADAEQLIMGLDRYEGRGWGVHDRKLFWRDKGSGRKWRLRRSQVSFSEEGDSSESAFNGVIVYYTDPAGSTFSVGPTNSNAANTDTDLEDTDPTNPVNARGLGNKWLAFQVEGMTTLAGATQIGIIALREMTRPTRGTATVVGLIEDDRGTFAWPWEIRDDDVVQFADEIGGPERIVTDVRYSREDQTAQVELDGPPGRLDVLLSRLQVVVEGLGLG